MYSNRTSPYLKQLAETALGQTGRRRLTSPCQSTARTTYCDTCLQVHFYTLNMPVRGSKAASSRRGKEPAARLTREKAKSHSSAQTQASKPRCSHKRPATTRTDEDENSSDDEFDSEPQVSRHRKKAKHSNKTRTVEEVGEREPNMEEVDEGELEDNESTDNPDKGKEDEVQSSKHIHTFCSYLIGRETTDCRSGTRLK
jgi:hypothetical protein